ncbi:MAG TPA: sugar phosphate isomerase/epimerase [Tepidisphaeraceae bacterium]|nr:sugar phosphate isomerase/epimerase [Tepidisphaeraceae bacterium]
MLFLRKLALAGGALALCLSVLPARAEVVIPDDCKTNGFAIGCQAWSFNHFTVLEAIEKTNEVGGKIIEFYPGQRLRKDQPAVTFSHHSPDAVIEQVQEQLKKYNIRAVAYGVVGPGGKTLEDRKAEWKQIFEFGKKLGLRSITSEPHAEDMDYIESLVKEYDICLGIHDHPKRDKDPNYKFWDPNYVLSLVKGRDKRMGSCADTGHWVRSGIKPVDAMKILEGRIISSHLKDLNQFGEPHGHDVPYGQGVSDVKGILDELKRQNFNGNISIEYEYHQENPMPEIEKCIEYVRNYGHTK